MESVLAVSGGVITGGLAFIVSRFVRVVEDKLWFATWGFVFGVAIALFLIAKGVIRF